MKRVLSIILVFCLLLTFGTVAFSEDAIAEETKLLNFEDIDGSWAKEYIEELAEQGIINGVSETEFAPDRTISRAEFLTMVFRVLKLSPLEYENIYPDVLTTDWYAEMLQAVYSLRLLDDEGFGGNFNGNQPITREEMASLLARGGLLYLETTESEEVTYADSAEFSSWAKGDIATVSAWKVMEGKEQGNFACHDNATRAETAAVIKRLMDVFTGAGYDTSIMPWRQAPIMIKASDEIKPGYAFNLYGYGFEENGKIYVEDAKIAGKLPSENAMVLEPTIYGDNASYVTAILPETATPGVYSIWVENSFGMSQAFYMNQARPWWVGNSDYYWEGQMVQLIGTNFMLDRVGAKTETEVKLLCNGKEYPAEIMDLEPYSIKFTVPACMPSGEFKIAVTNNGVTWVTLDNEQKLYTVEKSEDPYNLGVGWANGYVYDYRVNVKDFGAKGDGVADDTEAIGKALADIESHGGGICYFPIGTYRCTTIPVPGKTILEGEDREKTKLAYCGTDNSAQWWTSSPSSLTVGYQGMYNLTLTTSPEITKYQMPWAVIWIGQQWDSYVTNDWKTRTFDGMFIKSVNMDFPLDLAENDATVHFYGIVKQYLLMEDFNGVGQKSDLGPIFGNYVTARNIVSHSSQSCHERIGMYCIYENSHLIQHPDYRLDNGNPVYNQGIFYRSRTYLAHNTIENTGTPNENGLNQNDGEITASEPISGGRLYYIGQVNNATPGSITGTYRINPDGSKVATGWSVTYPEDKPWTSRFEDVKIVIGSGRGVGQWRDMVDYKIDENTNTCTFTVDRPWDIVPDGSSTFIVETHCEENIVYDNKAVNCEKGFWFYGGNLDGIIDGNTGINCEGILSRDFEIDNTPTPSRARYVSTRFVTIKNNHFEGSSRLGSICSINQSSIYVVNGDEGTFGLSCFGAEIRDNYMKGAMTERSPIKNTETTPINGILVVVGVEGKAPTDTLVHGVIIENNTLVNMKNGISIGNTTVGKSGPADMSGVLIKGNHYTNVRSHIDIYDGVENLVTIDE